MKVFLAWSGRTSEQLAVFMRSWLTSIVQAVDPFMSDGDLRQGQLWARVIGERLAETDFAILCLTPTNLESRWIHFEAGAVSKNISGARISALLFEVSPTQIKFPLQQFQATALTRDDLWRLVQSINRLCPVPLPEGVLVRAYQRAFPEMQAELLRLRKTLHQEQKRSSETPPKRNVDDVLSDLLRTQQSLVTRLDAIEAAVRRIPIMSDSHSDDSRLYFPPHLHSEEFESALQSELAEFFTKGDVSHESFVQFLDHVEKIYGPMASEYARRMVAGGIAAE